MAATRERVAAVAALGVIVLVAAALRLYGLTDLTIGQVEMFVPGIHFPPASGLFSRLTILDTFIGIVQVDKDPNPLGYYFLMLGWTKVFGTSILAIRLPSVLFGVGSVLLVYFLAKMEQDRWTALVAAGMVALNGYLIYWSQLAKMYAMGCFLGLAATLLLLLAAKAKNRQWFWQALYVGATLLGLGTVVYFWFLFAGHLLWTLKTTLGRRIAAPGLLRSQMLILILASPVLGLALLQGRRESYLSPNPLPELTSFLQFGFLFDPDTFAVPPKAIPTVAGVLILLLALVLLGLGLRWHKVGPEDGEGVVVSPPSIFLVVAGIFSFLATLRFAKFAYDHVDPGRAKLVAACAILALLLPLADWLIRRYWSSLQKLGNSLNRRYTLPSFLNSPSVILALFPVALITAINPIIPLFAARTVLIFTPYLLVVISTGLVGLIRRASLSVALAPILAVTLMSSVVYNQGALFERVVDYKSLTNQWIPNINDADLILVQPHWLTNPIFFYLRGERYHFIGKNYSKEMAKYPNQRVWIFATDGVPPNGAMLQATLGYTVRETLTARRATVVLYVKNGLVPSAQVPRSPNMGSVIPTQEVGEPR